MLTTGDKAMAKETYIDVWGDGEYMLSKIRTTKHGYEGKDKDNGWMPISESTAEEAIDAGVPYK
jgi:hypothetical protein